MEILSVVTMFRLSYLYLILSFDSWSLRFDGSNVWTLHRIDLKFGFRQTDVSYTKKKAYYSRKTPSTVTFAINCPFRHSTEVREDDTQ